MASRAAGRRTAEIPWQSLRLARFVLLLLLLFLFPSLFLFQILLTYIPADECACCLRDTRPKRTGHKRGSSFLAAAAAAAAVVESSRETFTARAISNINTAGAADSVFETILQNPPKKSSVSLFFFFKRCRLFIYFLSFCYGHIGRTVVKVTFGSCWSRTAPRLRRPKYETVRLTTQLAHQLIMEAIMESCWSSFSSISIILMVDEPFLSLSLSLFLPPSRSPPKRTSTMAVGISLRLGWCWPEFSHSVLLFFLSFFLSSSSCCPLLFSG